MSFFIHIGVCYNSNLLNDPEGSPYENWWLRPWCRTAFLGHYACISHVQTGLKSCFLFEFMTLLCTMILILFHFFIPVCLASLFFHISSIEWAFLMWHFIVMFSTWPPLIKWLSNCHNRFVKRLLLVPRLAAGRHQPSSRASLPTGRPAQTAHWEFTTPPLFL